MIKLLVPKTAPKPHKITRPRNIEERLAFFTGMPATKLVMQLELKMTHKRLHDYRLASFSIHGQHSFITCEKAWNLISVENMMFYHP